MSVVRVASALLPALFLGSSASALPQSRQGECGAPQFGNHKVTISQSALKLYPPSLNGGVMAKVAPSTGLDYSIAEWQLEARDTFFYIHPSNDASQSVQLSNTGKMQVVQSSPYEVNQQFRVHCKIDCAQGSSSGFLGDLCYISAVSDTSKCVHVDDGAGDRSISLQTCVPGSYNQFFNFEDRGNGTPSKGTTPSSIPSSVPSSAPSVPSASAPAPSPSACGAPQFGTNAMTIANSAVRLNRMSDKVTVDSPKGMDIAGEFLWQFETKGDYFLIHPVNDSSKAIQVDGTNLKIVQTSASEGSQHFRVHCERDCKDGGGPGGPGSFIGDGCNIFAATDSTKCVGLSGRKGGDPVTLQTCNKSDSQQYNFEKIGKGQPYGSTTPSTPSGAAPSTPSASDGCGAPQFKNSQMTIANSAVRLTRTDDVVITNSPKGMDIPGDFLWQFESKGDYFLIHPTNDTSKAIQAAGSNMQIAQTSASDKNQQFKVHCQRSCDFFEGFGGGGAFIGDGCKITAASDDNQCVTIGTKGTPVTLQTCGKGDHQQYNFEKNGMGLEYGSSSSFGSSTTSVKAVSGALEAGDDDGHGMGSWGPAIVGLLCANLLVTIGLAVMSLLNCIRRGGRETSSRKFMSSAHAPVQVAEERRSLSSSRYDDAPYKDSA